jgi:hypothetical protein
VTLNLIIIGIGLVCAIELGMLMARGEYLRRVLEVQLKGLGETHLLGFEALTGELQKLERRIKAIEDEVA